MKTCTQCHETKPLEAFSPNKTGRDGRHTWCRACKASSARYWNAENKARRREYDKRKYAENGDRVREQAKNWYLANRERSQENKRKWKLALHGLTDSRRDAIFAAQGNSCAICAKPKAHATELRVDHCHATLVVRGLLCHHCNVGIGHFFDSPDVLRAAAAYLERVAAKRTA